MKSTRERESETKGDVLSLLTSSGQCVRKPKEVSAPSLSPQMCLMRTGRFPSPSQVDPNGRVYTNTLGTVEVALASQCSRVSSALGRMSQSGWRECASRAVTHIGQRFSSSSSFAPPQVFHSHGMKLRVVILWPGRFRASPPFVSARQRAEWFSRWTLELPKSDVVNMPAFEQGLGRAMLCCGRLGVQKAVLGSSVQICVSPSMGVCPACPGLCVLLAVVSFQIDSNQWSLLMRRKATAIL